MESREHGTAPIAPRHWRKSFISLWLATPRASLARIRQAIATKQLRHGLTGADVQFSGTATSTSTPVGRRSLGRLRPAVTWQAEKGTWGEKESPLHQSPPRRGKTKNGNPCPPPAEPDGGRPVDRGGAPRAPQ